LAPVYFTLMKKLVPALVLCLLAFGTGVHGQGVRPASAPHVEKRGDATQLIVDGAPFLALAGELGNSSGEAEYLRPFWPALRAVNLNTVLAPVYWERLEPQEGRYDYSQVDALIADARANHVRLVLLWFASWKNSMSTYAPAWVKTNTARFPRAADSMGRSLDILSPFSAANRDADARAFAALMRHLREIDGQEGQAGPRSASSGRPADALRAKAEASVTRSSWCRWRTRSG
jgi:hypothetical protein